MSIGIPSVSTAYGNAVTTVVNDTINGFLVNTDEEWIATLLKLIDNTELRKSIGLAARQKAVNEFSVNANKGKYLNILNTVIQP